MVMTFLLDGGDQSHFSGQVGESFSTWSLSSGSYVLLADYFCCC